MMTDNHDDIPLTNSTGRTMWYWVDEAGTFHQSPEEHEGAVKLEHGEQTMLRVGVNREHGIAMSYEFPHEKLRAAFNESPFVDIVQEALKKASSGIAHGTDEIIMKAILRATGQEWVVMDVKARMRSERYKGDTFQTILLDGEPILELHDVTFENTDTGFKSNQNYRFLGKAAENAPLYGKSPAMAALPLVQEDNAEIGADTDARRAKLREAMRVIREEEGIESSEGDVST